MATCMTYYSFHSKLTQPLRATISGAIIHALPVRGRERESERERVAKMLPAMFKTKEAHRLCQRDKQTERVRVREREREGRGRQLDKWQQHKQRERDRERGKGAQATTIHFRLTLPFPLLRFEGDL